MDLHEAQDIVEDLAFTEHNYDINDISIREALKIVWQHSVNTTYGSK